MTHPDQPIVFDSSGVARFQENPVVRFLLEHGGINMTRLLIEAHQRGWADEDQAQFAQLIGYSVCGWGDLSYVSEEAFRREQGKVLDAKEQSAPHVVVVGRFERDIFDWAKANLTGRYRLLCDGMLNMFTGARVDIWILVDLEHIGNRTLAFVRREAAKNRAEIREVFTR